MAGSAPGIPVQLQIRRIIFEHFNDTEARFTNDEVFDVLQKAEGAGGMTIDDMEPFFTEICDRGLVRNIAQNFTTIWFKLFEPVAAAKCGKCGNEVHLGGAEERTCPNPGCGAPV
ncbi:hypothetical protein CENSYa_1348 [Cenarchaeum symbiosum A]|uniref:Uncharacterized protein n=1 Tax=Cenarchaeum symbiosum (strain A) TaxID=414004 RepID=A0RXA4_CENSY|nr:hypothetical protein CENSYa_1348 [Cenarchaeum symbiosum A]